MEIEYNIRSEEVQEIMERMPRKFIRWGSGAIFLLIILLVVMAAIIQYPDTISGNALLTTRNPPTEVAAKTTGVIEKLFVKDKAAVDADQTLAVIRNRASYQTVLWVDSVLGSHAPTKMAGPRDAERYTFWMQHRQQFEELGDLNSTFSGYIRSLKDFYLQTADKISLDDALNETRNKEVNNKAWAVVTQREWLRSALLSWKERYLLRATTKGTVSFRNYWLEKQLIKSGEPFCTIIPVAENILCRVMIPVAGSAKVKEGQHVRLVLASYPENEFGFLEGQVLAVSSVPFTAEESSHYVVTVSMQMPLMTSMKKQVFYLPEMQGTAEIITEKKTILTRLSDTFLSYWKKHN